MSLYESCDFSEGVIENWKIGFPLERIYGRIFLAEVGGKFSTGFFPSLSFLDQGEKNPAESQSVKVQGTSGEISVSKNVGKIMQNVGSRRFTPKLAKVAMLANTQNSIIINKGKDFKILKNRFNSYGRQVDSRTSEKKYIDRLDGGKIWYRTSWMLDFTCPTFRKVDTFGQVGLGTWAHINGCIDVCKCAEIFRHNLRSRVSNGWKSKWLKFCTKANQVAHQIKVNIETFRAY